MDSIGMQFINGVWTRGSGNNVRDVVNPATGKVIGKVAEGSFADVDAAVAAARKAFDEGPWRDTPALARASLLLKLADALQADMAAFAKIETENNGKPLREAEGDVTDAANCFRYYAGLITKPLGQTYDVPDAMQSMVVREPVGV
ncbi:MAG: aldehyde dehydrogenase family protein, partial [Fibrobacteraceae bacterium]